MARDPPTTPPKPTTPLGPNSEKKSSILTTKEKKVSGAGRRGVRGKEEKPLVQSFILGPKFAQIQNETRAASVFDTRSSFEDTLKSMRIQVVRDNDLLKPNSKPLVPTVPRNRAPLYSPSSLHSSQAKHRMDPNEPQVGNRVAPPTNGFGKSINWHSNELRTKHDVLYYIFKSAMVLNNFHVWGLNCRS